MKALTVRQPWAFAIITGRKDVENRRQLWKYRGTLYIHAGLAMSPEGLVSPLVTSWLLPEHRTLDSPVFRDRMGAIIGFANLVDTHRADPTKPCCSSPWAQFDDGTVHLVLDRAHAIKPVPCKGRLGLWDVPNDVLAAIQ